MLNEGGFDLTLFTCEWAARLHPFRFNCRQGSSVVEQRTGRYTYGQVTEAKVR
jgi:hypothetical protein